MIRDWTVTRAAPNGQVVLGVFELGGVPCASLERLAVQIPDGRYRVNVDGLGARIDGLTLGTLRRSPAPGTA